MRSSATQTVDIWPLDLLAVALAGVELAVPVLAAALARLGVLDATSSLALGSSIATVREHILQVSTATLPFPGKRSSTYFQKNVQQSLFVFICADVGAVHVYAEQVPYG
jgi:hypothetical protein